MTRPRLALASLALLVAVTGCPGAARDFSEPDERDAESRPPDGSAGDSMTDGPSSDAALEGSGGASSDAAPDVAPPVPLPVKIANFNTHDFFNDRRDSPEIANEQVLSTAEYRDKLDRVAGVLRSLALDLAVLVEVENEHVTADLAAKLGGYPHHTTSQGNDPRGIDIAVLSRFPLESVVSHKNDYFSPSTNGLDTYKYARDCLEVHLTVNGRKIVLLGIHFKAGSETKSQEKRLAEAERTRAIALALEASEPAAAVITLGDFNATPDSPPMLALVGAPPKQLTLVGSFVPASERYSFVYQGDEQLIDNQALGGRAAALLQPSTVSILHSAAVAEASDHFPVAATYLVE